MSSDAFRGKGESEDSLTRFHSPVKEGEKSDNALVVADRAEFLRFFDLLAPSEEITFQLFMDPKSLKKSGRPPFFIHGHPEKEYERLLRFNKCHMSICWMPNRGDLKGRQKENVIAVRALYVDLDGSPVEPLLTAVVTPSVVVESSPGRYHAYWKVKDCPLNEFRARQLQLKDRFGGDPSVANINSVMRVPGFLHQKDMDNPFLSRIILPKHKG